MHSYLSCRSCPCKEAAGLLLFEVVDRAMKADDVTGLCLFCSSVGGRSGTSIARQGVEDSRCAFLSLFQKRKGSESTCQFESCRSHRSHPFRTGHEQSTAGAAATSDDASSSETGTSELKANNPECGYVTESQTVSFGIRVLSLDLFLK